MHFYEYQSLYYWCMYHLCLLQIVIVPDYKLERVTTLNKHKYRDIYSILRRKHFVIQKRIKLQ
jgi:hypothetical protein